MNQLTAVKGRGYEGSPTGAATSTIAELLHELHGHISTCKNKMGVICTGPGLPRSSEDAPVPGSGDNVRSALISACADLQELAKNLDYLSERVGPIAL